MKTSTKVNKPATEPEVKQDDGLAAMVERLKASKQVAKEQDHSEGYEVGKYWAVKIADYRQISVLAENELSFYLDGDDFGWSLADEMARLIFGKAVAAGYIEQLHEAMFADDERKYSKDYVRGFVEGAAAQFREVQV